MIMNVSISARGGGYGGFGRLSTTTSSSSSLSLSFLKMSTTAATTTTSSSSPFFSTASSFSTTSKNALSFLNPSKNVGRFGLLRRRHHTPTRNHHYKNHLLRSFSSTTSSLSSSTSTSSTTTNGWSLRMEDELLYKEHGIIDERGLTQFDTLHEMITNSTTVYNERPLFGTYDESIQNFTWMSYKDYENKIHQCRAVLHDLGVREHSKVGIISNNRWEWATIAGACYSMNANLVPMYEAQLPVDWSYIVNDAQIEILVCATEDIYQRVQEYVVPNAPTLHTTLSLEKNVAANDQKEYGFSTLMSSYGDGDIDQKLIVQPTPDDLANLIYTSGTTGKPKGVELTHRNITSNVKGAPRTMVDNPAELIHPMDCSLSFLPWAHSYGQTCELFMSMSHGSSMGICRGVPYILDDIQMIKPTILFAVPTLYKKIYDGVQNVIETSTPIRKRLMQQALYLGDKHVQCTRNQNNNNNNDDDGNVVDGPQEQLSFMERIQFRVLDSIILSKIRNRFGGRLRHSFVAGAACPAEVLHFMDSIGIPVCEGYGLTETSPIIAINTPNQRQIGSVGKPIPDISVHIVNPETGKEVPIGEEGEICCIGPNVMRGYHNNIDATNEVITNQSPVIGNDNNDEHVRMFHTGDVGRMDSNGYVKVTGRIKEQYKLENGKYIVPTPIEETISLSRFINQVVIYGANRPYNVAMIVPEWNAIRSELSIQSQKTDDELMNDGRVHELIQSEITNACIGTLKKFEIPQKYTFVAPFTSSNNMLTPKMSIRRHKVIAEYMDVLETLYNNNNNNESKNHHKKDNDSDNHQQQQQQAAA